MVNIFIFISFHFISIYFPNPYAQFPIACFVSLIMTLYIIIIYVLCVCLFSISTIYYLSAADSDQAQEWMQAIRPQCSPNLSAVNSRIFRAVHEDPHFGTAAFNGAAAVAATLDESVSPTRKAGSGSTNGSSPAASAKGVSRLRSLYITMIEAHRLPVKITPHPFVVISLNTVKVARTSVKCPPDPIWEEDFFL